MRAVPALIFTLMPLAAAAPEAAATPVATPGPFDLTPEMKEWVRRVTRYATTQRGQLQLLLEATFRAQDADGLGIAYDNSRTRTVQEVWAERKANCISLTAFFVSASRHLGIPCYFAEPLNTNRWHRTGSVIRLERHIVALAPRAPIEDVVADFLPSLRKRMGAYMVTNLTDEQALALFHANRAVELLEGGDPQMALAEVQSALGIDPKSSISWNIQGVIQMNTGLFTLAETSLQKAASLDGRDGTPIGNLEVLMRQTGRMVEAQKYRDLGIAMRQKDPYFNAFLAEEAYGEGRLEEALDRIDRAISLMPYDPEFHLARAKVCLGLEKPDEARKSLKVAQRWAIPTERARYDSKLEALAKL